MDIQKNKSLTDDRCRGEEAANPGMAEKYIRVAQNI